MLLRTLMTGLPVIVACLVLQAIFVELCLRQYARFQQKHQGRDSPWHAIILLSMVMLQEANVLVLDEPTSHLDMESIEALQEALEEYQGTLVVVSHDREFIDSVATRVIVLEDGPGGKPKLTDWKGNYREYRLAREME